MSQPISQLARDANGGVVQSIWHGAVQNVTYSGSAGTSSAFGTGTSIIRIVSDGACFYLISTAGTAATTANGSYLPAGVVEYPPVHPGDKISVIQASGSTGTNLNVTEGAAP